MRLSTATLAQLPEAVARPGYDRIAQRTGIVHLGIGAFHRAHQAVYTDAAMTAGDHDWAIAGVSLRSAQVRTALGPQDGWYTVTERSETIPQTRLIGAVRDVLVAPEQRETVIDRLASADTRIVTLTVTEKGYLRTSDGALDKAAIASADVDGPVTIYGFLAAALARRRSAGLPGLTIVSCDNLAENGAQLAALLGLHLDTVDAGLARWFEAECACPSTMVDRIVPAITDTELKIIAGQIGMEDSAAILTEPFSQWVIEDRFAGPRPRWELGGAQFVTDVRAHEAAKLRLLNGAHSALAYLGLAAGYDYVHQAMADPAIAALAERLMRQEAAATLVMSPGHDWGHHIDSLLKRFLNPALRHRLIQIAMDGSQKIPQRWLVPLAINQAAGRSCPATLTALAAWVLHVRGDGREVDDPLGDRLAELWNGEGASGIVAALFGDNGLFAAHWTASAADTEYLSKLVKAPLPLR